MKHVTKIQITSLPAYYKKGKDLECAEVGEVIPVGEGKGCIAVVDAIKLIEKNGAAPIAFEETAEAEMAPPVGAEVSNAS
jgi:hypothetical protein